MKVKVEIAVDRLFEYRLNECLVKRSFINKGKGTREDQTRVKEHSTRFERESNSDIR